MAKLKWAGLHFVSHFTTSLNITFYIAWLCRHVTGTFQMSGRHMNTGINDEVFMMISPLLCDGLCFFPPRSPPVDTSALFKLRLYNNDKYTVLGLTTSAQCARQCTHDFSICSDDSWEFSLFPLFPCSLVLFSSTAFWGTAYLIWNVLCVAATARPLRPT